MHFNSCMTNTNNMQKCRQIFPCYNKIFAFCIMKRKSLYKKWNKVQLKQEHNWPWYIKTTCCSIFFKIFKGYIKVHFCITVNVLIYKDQDKKKQYRTWLNSGGLSYAGTWWSAEGTQPQHELELDLIMGRNPPHHLTRNF